MKIQDLVQDWFNKWEEGDFKSLPLADEFTHTSPFGVIKGKNAYLDLVIRNKDQFLGNKFEIEDELYNGEVACVRYVMHSASFSMPVSEWFYIQNGLISAIQSYYHVEGGIQGERELDV